jgi:hypothetical protein
MRVLTCCVGGEKVGTCPLAVGTQIARLTIMIVLKK